MASNGEQAESRNLNVGFLRFATALELYNHIREITAPGADYTVRNFVGVIEDVTVEASVCETELFPRGALEYYTKKNMVGGFTVRFDLGKPRVDRRREGDRFTLPARPARRSVL